MTVDIAFLAFAVLSLAAFRLSRADVAALSVYLGGWILLPVAHYPTASVNADFPYWITGLAVPSDLLLTKAWIAPLCALTGALIFDRHTLLKLRFSWLDLPVLLWCAIPVIQAAAGREPTPPSFVSCLYLMGCWGAPWLLGRLYFSGRDGALLLVKGLVFSALACLPFSLIEGVIGPRLYGWVYEPHPFRFDGDARYIGYRPIGFFEHGNQFGLWVSLCALAGVWLAFSAAPPAASRRYRWAAAIVLAMALAAQSVGGILLLVVGLGILASSQILRTRVLLVVALAGLILGGAAYVSGTIPIDKLGRGTAVGRQVVDAFKSAGRGSFTWRIAQDQRLLHAATQQPLLGSGHWDWWRAERSRPWGLAVLSIGQFGIFGLTLAFATILAPAVKTTWLVPRASPWQPTGLPLLMATLIGLTIIDALMNSFIFFPALLLAGALAGNWMVPLPNSIHGARPTKTLRGEITRVPRRA